MVAEVFKISQPGHPDLILKVCDRRGDFLRESYYLQYFRSKIPVPQLIDAIEPQTGVPGAILMECIAGTLLHRDEISPAIAWQVGSLLAKIHNERVVGYGDLTDLSGLSSDPRVAFTEKLNEGLDECKDHLPQELLEKCRAHFNQDIDLLLTVDGPCIIHRDFRPGNLMVAHGQVQGIIDWSSARGGFAEDDFCPLELGEWSENPDCKQAFLDGYATIRQVPAYQRLMPLLRLSRAIAAIGFTVKRGTWNGRNSKLYQFSRHYLDQNL